MELSSHHIHADMDKTLLHHYNVDRIDALFKIFFILSMLSFCCFFRNLKHIHGLSFVGIIKARALRSKELKKLLWSSRIVQIHLAICAFLVTVTLILRYLVFHYHDVYVLDPVMWLIKHTPEPSNSSESCHKCLYNEECREMFKRKYTEIFRVYYPGGPTDINSEKRLFFALCAHKATADDDQLYLQTKLRWLLRSPSRFQWVPCPAGIAHFQKNSCIKIGYGEHSPTIAHHIKQVLSPIVIGLVLGMIVMFLIQNWAKVYALVKQVLDGATAKLASFAQNLRQHKITAKEKSEVVEQPQEKSCSAHPPSGESMNAEGTTSQDLSSTWVVVDNEKGYKNHDKQK